jgi:aryl-alcohol dehydrogenase-like predicted oxidoreductase
MTLLLAGVAFKGVSQISVAEYERAKKTVDVVSIQNLYNVEDRSAEDVLLKCERDGIAFLPWFPLAGFRLTKACGSEANSFGTRSDADSSCDGVAARPRRRLCEFAARRRSLTLTRTSPPRALLLPRTRWEN